jgi:amidase
MIKISADNFIYQMAAKNEPVAEVLSGDKVLFETNDCFKNQLNPNNLNLDKVNWNQINPATGPLKIKEAKVGDTLKIDIDKINFNNYGVMLAEPEMVFIDDIIKKPKAKLIEIKNNKAIFNEEIQLDLNPMIGVIGVAPSKEKGLIPCDTPDSHGGNMDAKIITEGSTLYLPVLAEGGLLALGDLHASMADGEMVTGLEVAGEVTLSVSLIKEKVIPNPMLENEKYLYTIASDEDIYQACKIASKNMFSFLKQKIKIDETELLMLMGLICDIEICQVVDPKLTARVKIQKDKLKKFNLNFL